MPDKTEAGLGVSMKTVGQTLETVTVTLAVPMSGLESESAAETVIVWDPVLSAAVFNWYVKSTWGSRAGSDRLRRRRDG